METVEKNEKVFSLLRDIKHTLECQSEKLNLLTELSNEKPRALPVPRERQSYCCQFLTYFLFQFLFTLVYASYLLNRDMVHEVVLSLYDWFIELKQSNHFSF